MVRRPSELFESVRYCTKTTPELREAMARKLESIRGLIQQRELRMKALREEYSIDAERLAVLLMRFQNEGAITSYERQGGEADALVPAGVIANLVQEQRMIDSERSQIDKLELVLRNLRDEEPYAEPRTGEIKIRPCIHELTDHELEYLGF
jgi:hypothetical protein